MSAPNSSPRACIPESPRQRNGWINLALRDTTPPLQVTGPPESSARSLRFRERRRPEPSPSLPARGGTGRRLPGRDTSVSTGSGGRPVQSGAESTAPSGLRPRGTRGCCSGSPACSCCGSPAGSSSGGRSSYRPGSPGARPWPCATRDCKIRLRKRAGQEVRFLGWTVTGRHNLR